MQIFVKREEDFISSLWSGGTTKELAIYPQNAQYADRNFIWRLSTATVDVEESDFTALADYDRIIMVIKGRVKLVHKNIREVILCEFEQDFFSGSFETKSYGKLRDFNLMIRKGCQGFAKVIDWAEENLNNAEDLSEKKITNKYKMKSESFYCIEGEWIVELNGEKTALKKGELLSATAEIVEFKNMSMKGKGKVIRACVYFDALKDSNI